MRASALRSPQAAITAREMSLREHGHLRLVKSNGFNKLYEEGRGSGTFPNVPLHAKITIVSTSEGSFAFSAYLPGGVLNGQGRTHDSQHGAIDYFTGMLSVKGGTGRYAHASGNLPLKGAVSRPSYTLQLEVNGRLQI
jgi:hypothetical protein